MQFIELQMHKDTTNVRTEQTKMHTNVFLDAPVKKKLIRGGRASFFIRSGSISGEALTAGIVLSGNP
jgi:hypothetical protein